MMDCNKDEALKAKELAEKRFHQNDFDGAWRMALKAQKICPGLNGIAQMIDSLRVLVSAKVTIGQEKDWYAVLSVDPSAKVDVVKQQYRKMALILHPDKNKSIGADAAFKLVSEAFSILSDKKKRQAFDYKRQSRSNHLQKGPQLDPGSSTSITQKNATTSATNVHDSTYAPPTIWFTCKRCRIECEFLEAVVNQGIRCPDCYEPFLAAESGTSGSMDPQQQLKQQQKETEKKDRKVTSERAEASSLISGAKHTAATISFIQMKQDFPGNAKPESDPLKVVSACPNSSTLDCNEMKEREEVEESQSEPDKAVKRQAPDSVNPAGGTRVTVEAEPHSHSPTCPTAASCPDQQPTVTNKMKGNLSSDIALAKGSKAPVSNSSFDYNAAGQDQQHAVNSKMKNCNASDSCSSHTNKLEDIIIVREAPPISFCSDQTSPAQDHQPTDDNKSNSTDINDITHYTNSDKDIFVATEYHQMDMPHENTKSRHKKFHQCGGSDEVHVEGRNDSPKLVVQKPILMIGREGKKMMENERKEMKGLARSMIPMCDERKKKKYRLMSTLLEMSATAVANPTVMHVSESKQKVRCTESAEATSSSPHCSSNRETRVPIPFPDSDFYDCNEDRGKRSFGEGQIWAVYDNEDGMPRLYVLMEKILTSTPFKIQMAFLTSNPTPEFGTAMNLAQQPRFFSGCGYFQKDVVLDFHDDCIAIFSHQMHWEKLPRGDDGEEFRIFPCKGDVWVLYKNWSPNWGSHQQDVACEYEVVQVMEEYRKEIGVVVMPLVKLREYNAVFCRCMELENQRLVPRKELPRFSHRVPAHVLMSNDGTGALEGFLELDPAAMPMELLVDGENKNPIGKLTGSRRQRKTNNANYSLPCSSILSGRNKRRKTVPTPLATGVLVEV